MIDLEVITEAEAEKDHRQVVLVKDNPMKQFFWEKLFKLIQKHQMRVSKDKEEISKSQRQ